MIAQLKEQLDAKKNEEIQNKPKDNSEQEAREAKEAKEKADALQLELSRHRDQFQDSQTKLKEQQNQL